MPVVGPPATQPYEWFVVPVMPGIISQFIGAVFTGQHGTYTVVKTVKGNRLSNQYMSAGYGPPYDSYAAAMAAAKAVSKQAKANTTKPSLLQPGGSGVANSTNPLAGLFQANIWMRVGEVVLGIVLIAVGVAQLTHAVPLATSIAKVVK